MAFAGTTQKCMACDKTVYLVDKLTADNRVYHKACFRCHHCKGTLKVHHTPIMAILLFSFVSFYFLDFLLLVHSLYHGVPEFREDESLDYVINMDVRSSLGTHPMGLETSNHLYLVSSILGSYLLLPYRSMAC